MTNKILVIGGTGTVGSAVVEELKKANANYKVLTRKKEKAETLNASGIPAVVGRLGDWESVEPALEGINSIFLSTSPAADMIDLHKGMIDLAVKKGVKKIVRLSAEPANYSDGLYMYEHHRAADNYLKESGLDYVILRPHYFMQNVMMHLESINSNGMFAQYSGGASIPMIDVRDIAKAAFQVLTKDNFNSKTFVLTGPTSISYEDIAQDFSKVLDKNIQYTDMSYEQQETGFKAYGMEDWQLSTVMKVFKIWEDRGVSQPTNDYEEITNMKATSFETFVSDFSPWFK